MNERHSVIFFILIWKINFNLFEFVELSKSSEIMNRIKIILILLLFFSLPQSHTYFHSSCILTKIKLPFNRISLTVEMHLIKISIFPLILLLPNRNICNYVDSLDGNSSYIMQACKVNTDDFCWMCKAGTHFQD